MASTKKKPIAQKKIATNRIISVPTKSSVTNKKSRKFKLPSWRSVGKALAWPFVTVYRKLHNNRTEAPHKSFVRTRKRDKIKRPKVEGYVAFSWYVFRILWNRKWLYFRFIFTFFSLSIIFIGAIQASNVTSVNTVIDSASSGNNITGPIMRAAMTVGQSIGGALNANLSDVQYLYISALYILALLTVIWLLRHQLAGRKVKVRDGLYNAAAPISAQYVLLVIGVLQLIPSALVTLVYISATTGGLLDGGIETAMFSIALLLVIVLTLYFMTTTLFAMFIASIPGTYPIKAYRAARKIVSGQRLRLLLRLFWMVVVILAAAFVVLVPIIIIANSIGAANTVLVPIAYQLALVTGIVYATAYSYLLYRRMIDDPVVEK